VLYHGTEFYINLDHVKKPELGYFLEVKSRTWSRRDADYKALHTQDLIRLLGASTDKMVVEDYIEIAEAV
jgi:5-methylthioadenosine/S-adenosylhomocysteine deaminase